MEQFVAYIALSALDDARSLWINADPEWKNVARDESGQGLEEEGSFARGLAYGLFITAILAAIVVGSWFYIF